VREAEEAHLESDLIDEEIALENPYKTIPVEVILLGRMGEVRQLVISHDMFF
jgi:hypothetical protein